jgi:hypothetical protein
MRAPFFCRNSQEGLATVVFDGYDTGASITDNTYQRRGKLASNH